MSAEDEAGLPEVVWPRRREYMQQLDGMQVVLENTGWRVVAHFGWQFPGEEELGSI